jgi:3alpha(or 20beta)-hydroxysteroid dehydrogenase
MAALDGKVAIITGAARGQGAAEARLFAREGAKVVLTDLSEAGQDVADEIGADALFVQHDVGDEAAWSRVVAAAVARYGRIDILINNAGVYQPRSLQDTDQALMDFHYRINQLGVFLGMKGVIEPMTVAGSGSIVNLSSQAGFQGHPGLFAYTSTKWAIRGMTRSAAADLAQLRIRVNSVHPGMIDTPMLEANSPEARIAFAAMIPLGRLGTADDVAQMVMFLASDNSSYCTGGECPITGGFGT